MKRIITFLIVIVSIILFSFIQSAKAEIKQVTLRVDGLACPFCAYGLEKKIIKMKGVNSYDVDMREGKVFVGFDPDAQIELNVLHKAVKEAGFTLRNISVRAKGKISQSEEGLALLVGDSDEKFLLFESGAIFKKYHSDKLPEALGENLKNRLIEIKNQEKVVLIEGTVHEHKGVLPGLSVENLEIIE